VQSATQRYVTQRGADGLYGGEQTATKPANKLIDTCIVVMQRKPEMKQPRRINMPAFGSPFSGLANDRKLNDEELIRAIRFMVASEYEATQLYTQLAESTDNKLAVKVLQEIADEELVHAGEFLRLLHELAPNEEKLYAKGAKEVAEMIKKKK